MRSSSGFGLSVPNQRVPRSSVRTPSTASASSSSPPVILLPAVPSGEDSGPHSSGEVSDECLLPQDRLRAQEPLLDRIPFPAAKVPSSEAGGLLGGGRLQEWDAYSWPDSGGNAVEGTVEGTTPRPSGLAGGCRPLGKKNKAVLEGGGRMAVAEGVDTAPKGGDVKLTIENRSTTIDDSKLLGVEAPDGSSFLAYMGGYRKEFDRISNLILKKREAGSVSRSVDATTFFGSEHQTDGVLIERMSDLEMLYNRHQAIFLGFLFLDFVFTMEFLWLYANDTSELVGLRESVVDKLRYYWILFVCFCLWSVIFYASGVLACWNPAVLKHFYMRRFSLWALAGIVLVIFGEYVRKFNLLLFFFKLVLHLYAKFLITLNQHFFLTNSGHDVYQLLTTRAVPENEDDDGEYDDEDDYAETRQALLESQYRAHGVGGYSSSGGDTAAVV